MCLYVHRIRFSLSLSLVFTSSFPSDSFVPFSIFAFRFFLQVMENCADDLLELPVRLASKDIPTPYAQKLEEATIIQPVDVVNTSLWLLTKRQTP